VPPAGPVEERRAQVAALKRANRDLVRANKILQDAAVFFGAPLFQVVGVEVLLVNAHHVKNLPGRKTDVADAAWLAQLLECGLLRGSFVPPPVISRLRDLTRYRTRLVQDRAREIQRVQKMLEIAGIKLDSVVADVNGKAARRMLDALVAGNTDVDAMADMALTRMRPKIAELRLALEADVTDHHRLMLGFHLGHVDQLTATIERLDEEVAREIDPFVEQVRLLRTIPGIGQRTAEIVIAEIGVDMTRFPTAGHLASWAGMCPGNHESAGKRRSGRARKGDRALRVALCEAAWSAARTRDTYLGAQFRRFSRRMGKKNEGKAIFAVGHTLLVIIWHVLATGNDYHELGVDYFDRHDQQAETRRHVAALRRLGHDVTITPAA
jgi:transposase